MPLVDKVVTPRIFALVCFRLVPPQTHNQELGSKLNQDLLDAVNSTGKIFISHTVISARLYYYFFFVCVCGPNANLLKTILL